MPSPYRDLLDVSSEFTTPELLSHLIVDRFPERTVVTASLKAPSLVVLRMVADINPATPVIFCIRGVQFPESLEFRQRITDLLQLENVTLTSAPEITPIAGDRDHAEQMWVEGPEGLGRSFEKVHLNDSLADFDCWISAVYHVARKAESKNRVDVEGRLIRVDPLLNWWKDDIRDFMKARAMPYHPRVAKIEKPKPTAPPGSVPDYHY